MRRVKRNTKYATDWLGTEPVFYNEKTARVSNNINDVIDFGSFEFHPEGVNNFLEYGYSVFGQTPVKNVKFLGPHSRISVSSKGKISVKEYSDPAEKWYGRNSTPTEAIEKLQRSISNWEKRTKGEIVIPTSGGYDSRLLNFFIRDKSRIRSFSYGVSTRQSESFEVVFAKRLAEKLGTKWEQVELGNYHEYFDEWDELFGCSTHAHGMYHMEFYGKILEKLGKDKLLLSGLFGDIWAGSTGKKEIGRPEDMVSLGYSHGLHADISASVFKTGYEIRNDYWERNKKKLQDQFFQTLLMIRSKMILISYLLKVPEKYSFKPWSPFLDLDVDLSMLTLPQDLRRERKWQKEFFRINNILIEEEFGDSINRSNTLNRQAIALCRPKSLNAKLLKEVVRPEYVDWINGSISGIKFPAESGTMYSSQVNRVMNIARKIPHKEYIDKNMSAYFAYLTLRPLENIIVRRNNYFLNNE